MKSINNVLDEQLEGLEEANYGEYASKLNDKFLKKVVFNKEGEKIFKNVKSTVSGGKPEFSGLSGVMDGPGISNKLKAAAAASALGAGVTAGGIAASKDKEKSTSSSSPDSSKFGGKPASKSVSAPDPDKFDEKPSTSSSSPDPSKFDGKPEAKSVSAPDPDKFSAKRTFSEKAAKIAKDVYDQTSSMAKEAYNKNPDAFKYAGIGTAAIGAGLGAMALAKKLRNKKKSVKKDK